MKLLALSIDSVPKFGIPGYSVGAPKEIGPLAGLSLSRLVQRGITVAIFAAVILAFIFFVIGGVKWLASQGDKKQVEEAQKTITYAVIGLIVVFFSFFIIAIIGYFFKIPLLGW